MPRSRRTLYIGGLPQATAPEVLRAAFERHGALEDVRLIRRRDGIMAYVTFAEEAAAHDARDALDGSELAGHRLRVEFAI